MYFAHSRNARGERQGLVAHLRNVAELAADFAGAFGAAEAGRQLGLYHDIGKISADFQGYLLGCEDGSAQTRGPDHKRAGAALAAHNLGPLAMLIQAHHGGLQTPTTFREWLGRKGSEPAVAEALTLAPRLVPELANPQRASAPAPLTGDPSSSELFLRMLFSALVDADFLDTEAHLKPQHGGIRGSGVPLGELWQSFDTFHRQFSGRGSDPVSAVRDAVYQACLQAADLPPGLFRLTVPTGGGKTLSAMAFALRHALKHGHQRVIVAVPFITITEQTAQVYREVFGNDTGGPAVLEHHSAAWSGGTESDEFDPREEWRRLAAENWDAPVIVTTTVQLFESLFASKPARCRKLHRLARSVLILDEAQALPSHLLEPSMDALRLLCSQYGSTVVLSTATQPAFEVIAPFRELEAVEIVPNPEPLFRQMKRVSYEWRIDPPMRWDEVANLLRGSDQALVVVNTKKDALALLDALGDPDALHLSTLLCGAHRHQVIREVGRRLRDGAPCRLVSTQVIEAGVDLDFPLVVRALGPLDGIIQSAGRCNREGRLDRGRVVVFRPAEGGSPKGAYLTGIGVTSSLLGSGDLDPDDPSVPHLYFNRLFELVDTDREGIQKLRHALDYPEVARRFRMVDDSTESVVVPYGASAEIEEVSNILDRLREPRADARRLLRRIQPYLVSVRSREAERYHRQGLIEEVLPGLGRWLGSYDPVRGLTGEGPDPDSLVI